MNTRSIMAQMHDARRKAERATSPAAKEHYYAIADRLQEKLK